MKNGFRNSNVLHNGFHTLACITKLHVKMPYFTPDTVHNKKKLLEYQITCLKQ